LPLSRTAAWIPRIVLTITLTLTLVQLVREARELSAIARSELRRGGSTLRQTPAGAMRRPMLPSRAPTQMRTISAFVAVMWIAGALISVLIFRRRRGQHALRRLHYLHGHGRASWLSSATFSLVLGACLQLAFSSVLHVELYRGWLWNTLQQ
jgi:hypothetical protein